jgi:hypothetical protein
VIVSVLGVKRFGGAEARASAKLPGVKNNKQITPLGSNEAGSRTSWVLPRETGLLLSLPRCESDPSRLFKVSMISISPARDENFDCIGIFCLHQISNVK